MLLVAVAVAVWAGSVVGAELILNSPNGSERLVAGQSFAIAWQTGSNLIRIQLEYSSDNGSAWNLIDANAPNTGSYDWIVPQITSDRCLVRISYSAPLNIIDLSNASFMIYVCPLAFDMNYDCLVNFLDFRLLASQWLMDGDSLLFFNYNITSVGTEPGDANPDVNFNWTLTTTARETWTETDQNSLTIDCAGYNELCTYYLSPSDANYQADHWTYTDFDYAFDGMDYETAIDAANNRLIIGAFSGGWWWPECCEFDPEEGCAKWCFMNYDGYWRATYHLTSSRPQSGPVSLIQTGSGTVNAAEGDKFIANFDLAPPDPEHSGTVDNVEYAIITDNPNVIVSLAMGPGEIYARTDYTESGDKPWSDAQSGSAVILPGLGRKFIITSPLIAPNGDTIWSVEDDSALVDTSMAGPDLYAETP